MSYYDMSYYEKRDQRPWWHSRLNLNLFPHRDSPFINVTKLGRFRDDRKVEEGVYPVPMPEAPVRTEFLLLLRISEFFGFQWQNLAEILSLLPKGHFWPILGHLGPFRVIFWPSWVILGHA